MVERYDGDNYGRIWWRKDQERLQLMTKQAEEASCTVLLTLSTLTTRLH